MQYVNALMIVAKLIPAIYELVKQLDAVAQTQGTGADKLQTVLDAVSQAVAGLKADGVTWDVVQPIAKAVVEGVLKISRR